MHAAPKAASVWPFNRLFGSAAIGNWLPCYLLVRVTIDMQRLQTRPQFQAVLAGRNLARTAHFALHCCPLTAAALPTQAKSALPLFPLNEVWLGAMVPKRWAKRAVTRNAIKRQIYILSSEFEITLAHQAHVVRLRAAFDRSQYVSATSDALKRAVRNELQQLFSRAVTA